jgi:hypothetical protein
VRLKVRTPPVESLFSAPVALDLNRGFYHRRRVYDS